jgi:WD40 repeat protein
MESEDRKAYRRRAKRTHKMDHVFILGTNTHVGGWPLLSLHSARAADFVYISEFRNPSSPRLASSSKDGTVKVWAIATRRLEYTLGGHTASVNVVRWGGGGLNGKGVLYTASSDRTVRIWDANGVRFCFQLSVCY